MHIFIIIKTNSWSFCNMLAVLLANDKMKSERQRGILSDNVFTSNFYIYKLPIHLELEHVYI
jgi:hypothetical protein